MSVVTTGELDQNVATGEPSRHTNGAHGGFGSRVDHPHSFDRRDRIDHQFGELRFQFAWCTETGSLRKCSKDRVHDRRMPMSQDMRTPRSDVIDVSIAIDIEQVGSIGSIHHNGCTAHGTKGSGRTVDSSGNRLLGSKEMILTLALCEAHKITVEKGGTAPSSLAGILTKGCGREESFG